SATASASGEAVAESVGAVSGPGIEVRDQLAELVRPALAVAAEGPLVLLIGHLREAALDERERGAVGVRPQRDLDVRPAGVVVGRAVEMPGVREAVRFVDVLDPQPRDVAAVELQRGGAAWAQVDVGLVAEPGAQALGRGQRGPDDRRWVGQFEGA